MSDTNDGNWLGEACDMIEDLKIALDESLRLQSHYAKLLNQYDGGKRKSFKTIKAWISRLRKTGTIPKANGTMNVGELNSNTEDHTITLKESELENYCQPEDQTITFFVDRPEYKEILKFEADGKFYVEGKLVAEDKEVFDAFRKWINLTMDHTITRDKNDRG